MKIAQVAPLYESVPPQLYGGTERVVSYLTEELVRQGHDVTLFASGDSITTAVLEPVCRSGAPARHMLGGPARAPYPGARAGLPSGVHDFDIVHYHLDYVHFPLSRRTGATTVTTLHGRLDIPDLLPLYHEFTEMPVVSISDAQREPLPHANWVATVPHGLPPGLLPFRETPRRLPRVPGPNLAREARRPGGRDRAARRAPFACGGQDRRRGSRVLRTGDRAVLRRAVRRLRRRDRRGAEGRLPRRRARRCSSPSTGANRSAW